MLLSQERTVCRRSTPSYCKEEKKSTFPNSPLRFGLYLAAKAGQTNSLFWLITHERFASSKSTLSEFEQRLSPYFWCSKYKDAATSSSYSHAAPAGNKEPRPKLNSRGKTMEINVIPFFSSFLAVAEGKTRNYCQNPDWFCSRVQIWEKLPHSGILEGLCYVSSPLAEKAAVPLSVWGSFSRSVPAWQRKFSVNPASPRSCHETGVSTNWNFRHVLHSGMFQWNFLLGPFLRLLRKRPWFALYHAIHFAEGTHPGVRNMECCI